MASALLKPYVFASPAKPEPLLADAEVNSYRTSEKPWAAGLFFDLMPQSVAANRPVGARIISG